MYNHNMHRSSQLTPHKPSSCFFKQYNQKKKKQTLSEQFREPKSGAEKHWSADNEWKKHCGYSSWSSLNSGTLRKEVVLSGYLHVLFLLDFISQCDDKKWIIVFFLLISAPQFPVGVIYRVSWILQRASSGCGQLIAAPFGALQRNSGVGVLENALPLGNNTTTQNSLSPPTHLCTFWSVISGNRNSSFFGGNKQKNGSVW